MWDKRQRTFSQIKRRFELENSSKAQIFNLEKNRRYLNDLFEYNEDSSYLRFALVAKQYIIIPPPEKKIDLFSSWLFYLQLQNS